MLQNLAVTIVPLQHRYREPEIAGTIFHYHHYFQLKKHCHKNV